MDEELPTIEEIEQHHHSIGANFGATSPFDVVKNGILKVACGWHNGMTCQLILKHHGLITIDKAIKSHLTRKGQMFIWEHYKMSDR